MPGKYRGQLDLLAACIPTRVSGHAEECRVRWMHAEGVCWDLPFFRDVVERAEREEQGRASFLTGLDALRLAAPRRPALLIFHLGRCGSTLLSRLLSEPTRLRILNEPEPLNALLAGDPREGAAGTHASCDRRDVKFMVSALCRGGARRGERTAIKLTSWSLHRTRLFRELFRSVPKLLLVRDPASIEASLDRAPPAWLDSFKGRPPADGASDNRAYLTGLVRAAARHATDWDYVVDYRDIPAAARKLRELLRLPRLGPERERAILAEDAKQPGRDFCPPPAVQDCRADWTLAEWELLSRRARLPEAEVL